jgi:hypothetical protein
MKNSSSARAAPAVSIEVGNPAPAMAREHDGREPEFEAVENKGIDGTCKPAVFC